MEQYVRQLRKRADWQARRIGLFAFGIALLGVSLGFLTAAVWAYLATEFSPVLASLLCSVVFLVAAVGLFVIAASDRRPEVPPIREAFKTEFARSERAEPGRARAPGERPPLLDAFLTGFETYTRLRRKRD